MVNFMCPLAWAMAPRHLVKHYSGCFCEYVFWMKITFWGKQVALHNVGGPHSVSRRPSWDKDWPPQERKNSPYSSSDWMAASVSPWVPSLMAHLNVLDLPLKLPEPILYYISMCVCVCVRTIFLVYRHAHPISSFLWRTLTNACMNWNVKNKPGYFNQPTQITSLLPIHPGTLRVKEPQISPWGVDFQSIICLLLLLVSLPTENFRLHGKHKCQQCDQIAPSFGSFWDFLGHPLNKLTQLVRRAA